MPPIGIEICIAATDAPGVRAAVRAAYRGGADRVELCRAMAVDGLTPAPALVEVARHAFQDRPGLLVMLRPRAGNFQYAPSDLQQMIQQMPTLKAAGADGVVLGVLQADGQVDHEAMVRLMAQARRVDLAVTFHRAFDAVSDPQAALEALVGLGVDRILTAGVPWGRPGTVLTGLPRLQVTRKQAAGRVEVVLGGGVRARLVPHLTPVLQGAGPVSLHAYSGVQVAGLTDEGAVRALVAAARAAG